MAKVDEFYRAMDQLGMAERHAQRILRLEESESKKLLGRYREIRRELRDRLETLRGDTFSAQQLRGTLLQVETAIYSMNESLQSNMLKQGKEVSAKAIEDLALETATFERKFKGAVQPLNLNAARIVLDVENFKLNQYQASLDKYGQSLISDITLELGNSVLMNDPLSRVVTNLGRKFQTEEWKLLRIARTELHNTYSLAKLEGMKDAEQTMPDMKKALYHPMDDRTAEDSKDLAIKNPIIPVDEPFVHTFQGKTYRFMAPPQRPNDRAILIPYRDSWFG